jgi:hypothetical protein
MRCLARHQLVQRVLRQWEAQVAMRCLARLGSSPRTVGGHQQNEQKALPSKFLGHQLVQRVLRQWEAQVAIRCLARPGSSPRTVGGMCASHDATCTPKLLGGPGLDPSVGGLNPQYPTHGIKVQNSARLDDQPHLYHPST